VRIASIFDGVYQRHRILPGGKSSPSIYNIVGCTERKSNNSRIAKAILAICKQGSFVLPRMRVLECGPILVSHLLHFANSILFHTPHFSCCFYHSIRHAGCLRTTPYAKFRVPNSKITRVQFQVFPICQIFIGSQHGSYTVDFSVQIVFRFSSPNVILVTAPMA